ncbi:MAG TPA: 4-hydroxy-tetrahydrodipicolinate synthase [Thermococcus litoralis]|uniref:4-hydroxy-tetrahydrodipicolinate synthase n=1 Tax=Thermococcus litoralis TaxID=2265 RepID=A0A7C0XZ50_THELI|nr:MAG: 4-hydroxy-tetrahydrodipicolinate synthase [Thermococci archaeon]HDD31279.1 4-hydroxy-tetrahydrodipicolinate synthase [Thermococcus litoralis]
MFEGVFVPHITPFDDEEEINEEMLRELVHYFADAGLSGLITLGSNGEFPYLSFEEKLRVLKIVREESPVTVIAGVAENSTKETIRLAKEAWDIGVDALLIAPPYYFKPDKRELFAHYSRIAYEVEAPILFYNVPKFTTINIDLDVIEKLVDEHSNIVGIKDSSGSIGRITELVRRVGDKISILAGTADVMYPSWVLGAHGAVVAVANVAPRLCVELYNAFLEKRYERARKLQIMINHLNEVVVKKYNQISAIKEAMRMLGFEVGYPRMPALPLDERALEDIERTLIEIGLL